MSSAARYLTREELLVLLHEHGFPIGKGTLDKLCMPSRNEGPPVARWWPDGRGGNQRPLYEAEPCLAWAEARCRPGSNQI